MWTEPAIGAAFVAAIAGLLVAIVGLIPHLGRLHRLERVVSILEKVQDEYAREPLLVLRDRMIDRLRPRELPDGFLFLLAIAFFMGAAIAVGLGVWWRVFPGDQTNWSSALVLLGVLSLVAGLVTLSIALVRARRVLNEWRAIESERAELLARNRRVHGPDS